MHTRGHDRNNRGCRARGTAPLALWELAKASATDMSNPRAELTQEEGTLRAVDGTEVAIKIM